MDKRGIRVVQLNCQNAYSVICDLGNVAKKRGVSVLTLQEPYMIGCVCGLPSEMRVYIKDGGGKTAIVVNDDIVNAMCVAGCIEEHGVCVCVCG